MARQPQVDVDAIKPPGRLLMAHALRIRAHVASDTLTLRNLGEFAGKNVEVIVLEEETAAPAAASQRRRPLGLYRGQVVVTGDIDAPLPPELQRFFDGEGDEP